MKWIGCIVAALALLGCAERPDGATPNPDGNSTNGAADASTEVPPDAAPTEADSAKDSVDNSADIPLSIKSWDEVQQWVASQRGKVVVVDVWSTFCHPCIREFPHFVELHKTHGDRVACASLSIDFYGGEDNTPEDVEPRVRKFLTRQGATMPNFISRDTDETVLGHIGAAAIPISLVYDREGQLRTAFSNDSDAYGPEGFSYEKDIIPLVEELLKSAG